MRPRQMLLALAVSALGVFGLSSSVRPGQDEAGVKVWLDDMHAVTYQVRLEGDWLIVQVTHEAGWHTYSMDNVARARKKSGKARPETELPTVVTLPEGLTIRGEWRQSPPVDLSTPEIRWYTWGFEGRSYFAARVEKTAERGSVLIDAQACTDSLCAMVDALEVPVDASDSDGSWSVDPDSLVIVAHEDGPDGR